MEKEKIERVCKLNSERDAYERDLESLSLERNYVGVVHIESSSWEFNSEFSKRYTKKMYEFHHQLMDFIREKIDAIDKELEEL